MRSLRCSAAPSIQAAWIAESLGAPRSSLRQVSDAAHDERSAIDDQLAGGTDVLGDALRDSTGDIHPHAPAERRRQLSPPRENLIGRSRSPGLQSFAQRLEQLVARLIQLRRPVRRRAQVDAYPADRLARRRLNENPAELTVIEEQVVGPLEPDPRTA